MSAYRNYYDGYSRRYSGSSASGSSSNPSTGTSGASVTSNYRTSSSYRSPYTPSSTTTATSSRDRSSSRDNSSTAALIDKYSSKDSSDRLSLKEKYSYGTYPGRDSSSTRGTKSTANDDAERDKGGSSYRTLGRSTSAKSRDNDHSPEPPDKLYGGGSSGSLSSYRLYGRGTYSRSTSRDAGDSSTSSTPATTPVQIPTSLRFGSSTRYGVSVRSPVSEKPPPVFGLSTDRYGRFQRTYGTEDKKPEPAPESEKEAPKAEEESSSEESSSEEETDKESTKVFVTVVTRGTSPTPPSTSPYLRIRRADLARVIEKTVAKPTTRPEMVDKEIQSDRGDDTARLSRYGATSRSSAWSYLDRYGGSSYSSPVSRYTSRYGYGSTRSDRDTSVTSSKPSADISTHDAGQKSSVAPVEAPKSETTKKEPAKLETQKVESKTEGNKVVPLPKSSPTSTLVSKELNKSTNKLPLTKSSSEPTTKETDKDDIKPVNHDTKPKVDIIPKTETNKSPTSKSPVVSRSDSIRSLNESPTTKSPNVSRSDSFKNVAGKPPLGKADSSTSVDATSSQKAKSNSSSSLSEAPQTKTPPLSLSASRTLSKSESADAAKLPPPVPKPDGSLKTSSSLQTLNKSSVVNKDFRKSPLNVDLPNGTEAETFKKQQEKQRLSKKNSSVSSSDAEPSSADSPAVPSVPGTKSSTAPASRASPVMAADKNAAALRLSKSLSKLTGSSTPNFLEVPKTPGSSSPKRQSPARSKSRKKVAGRSPSRSPRVSISHSSSGSDASSSSSETSSTSSSSSSESSSEESEEENEEAVVLRRQRPKCSPEKRVSTLSARSSGDDLAPGSVDKPPRPPSSKSASKPEEAKSFLMRALAPVTNLFRRTHDTESSADLPTPSPILSRTPSTHSLSKDEDSVSEKDRIKKVRIKRIESGERAWWLDDNAERPEGVLRLQSNKSIARLAEAVAELKKSNENIPGSLPRTGSSQSLSRSSDESKSEKKKSNKWLEVEGVVPEGVKRLPSNKSIAKLAEAVAELQKSDSKPKYRISRQESGERAWWLDRNANIPEGIQRILSNSSLAAEMDTKHELKKIKSSKSISKMDNEDQEKPCLYRIRHVESGEKAWWLSSCGDIPEGIIRLETSSSESSDSESEKKDSSKADDATVPKFPLVIPKARKGSTGSLKDSVKAESPKKESSGRRSPYDNVQETSEKEKAATTKARPKNLPLFIGSHTNIDDILGSAATMVEPAMGVARIKKKLEGVPSDDENLGDSECEEVDPGQVLIHDSTAKKPNIERIRSNSKDNGRRRSSGTAGMIKLDDTALQLYKDGDYGSYLDLEASINEQHEEFEGFQDNRKNSIVLRTQLSVRVHTIIEKLLNSEGRELRRALFSLKQIFQEDKDLVHEFVQNDGLACLIKVGSEADQNYQNYILRALGQVMLYVDGMNGVMEHNETVQWLYTLIASKYRLVVKTALKLLLVFVEYVETNCLLLIKAIHNVDKSHGMLPWSNIMKLLKDYDAADTELLIYATSLINKTLNGIPDQDTYYDQVDALEEQGMEGTVQRYMSKQGTDLDLLRQLQIYEAVLHHEDGEDRGSPLKQLDENIRKTLRNRKALNDTISTERRKSRRHSTGPGEVHVNGTYKEGKENQKITSPLSPRIGNGTLDGSNKFQLNRVSSRKDMTPLLNAVNAADSEAKTVDSNGILKKPWVLSMMYGKNADGTEAGDTEEGKTVTENGTDENSERKLLLQLKRENTVKDLTQKLSSQNILHSPVEEGGNKINRIGDMTGLISKAKEGLARSKSKADVTKSPTGENVPKLLEVKKSETELQWEGLVNSITRPLSLCDLDFTDLKSEDEVDILSPTNVPNGVPPPPPPVPMLPGGNRGGAPPPPPPVSRFSNSNAPPPPAFGVNLRNNRNSIGNASQDATNKSASLTKKTKKTVKLFWKEVRDDPIILAKLQKSGMIWDELNPVNVDTQKLEHLFESRAKDLISKKQQEMNKNKEIIVLDHKRSNAINIGMTKLPAPRSIKTAILKMDATIMNREGIEKLLTMLPTEEERAKIQEAQMANPDLPLGSAEQFLLTLASISELPARLKLWAFKLDYENSEKEIAEPLMDLKQGMETLRNNKTFRGILSTLLSIGIFLNGNEVKGFQIEYLAKVPEVKDTVHKHSLLHHLCHMVMEKFPESTDLYSEIGAVTRASKVDFDELASNILKMEQECKASWDHLKLIAKHDGTTMMKAKMSDFLSDCAERIIVLGIVHRRVMNRFHKFLLWLGIPLHRVQDMKPNEFCRIVSEFSLEYRTTRERVLQQLEKKANHRERNKTRGKMITEVGKFRTKEDRADAELRQLLGSDISDAESIHGTLPWRRQRKDLGRTTLGPLISTETVNGNLTDGDDEILESLVKTATKAPTTRTTPRERKRTRHADRKSLKRSRTRENNTIAGNRESP